MSRASTASRLSIVASIAHPTIIRLNRSSTTARYSHPSAVAMYVMSAAPATCGASRGGPGAPVRRAGEVGGGFVWRVPLGPQRRVLGPHPPQLVVGRGRVAGPGGGGGPLRLGRPPPVADQVLADAEPAGGL